MLRNVCGCPTYRLAIANLQALGGEYKPNHFTNDETDCDQEASESCAIASAYFGGRNHGDIRECFKVSDFWNGLQKFRLTIENGGLRFTDDDFADLRDRSVGREIV